MAIGLANNCEIILAPVHNFQFEGDMMVSLTNRDSKFYEIFMTQKDIRFFLMTVWASVRTE